MFPPRKYPAHPPPLERLERPIIIFVTVCAARRKRIFANRDASTAILTAWQCASSWRVGRYVIMPDHIHFFCGPNSLEIDVSLNRWVKFWKGLASLQWPNRNDHPIWQRDFWDTQLRRRESYEEKWEYVRHNPVRHGYVQQPDDWPYAGELNTLAWW